MAGRTLSVILHDPAGVQPADVQVTEAVIAGWTGRDPIAVEKHIRELEALGVNHGTIDTAFDRKFLAEMGRGDLGLLANYPTAALEGAGAGAVELLSWIALAGALQRFTGEIVAYEPVIPWATGIGLMSFRIQESV